MKVLKTRKALRTTGALCDDYLSTSELVRPRELLNARCKDFVLAGELVRQVDHCSQSHRNKIVNHIVGESFFSSGSNSTVSEKTIDTYGESKLERFWESNVQEAIVSYLRIEWRDILNNANTASREAGKDIIASKNN